MAHYKLVTIMFEMAQPKFKVWFLKILILNHDYYSAIIGNDFKSTQDILEVQHRCPTNHLEVWQ